LGIVHDTRYPRLVWNNEGFQLFPFWGVAGNRLKLVIGTCTAAKILGLFSRIEVSSPRCQFIRDSTSIFFALKIEVNEEKNPSQH
jgi:hypothetical protein